MLQATYEASKTFRKLRGYTAMPELVAALRAHDIKLEPKALDDSERTACFSALRWSVLQRDH